MESKFLYSTDTRPVIKVQKQKHKIGHCGTLQETADRARQRGQQTRAQCAAMEGVEDTHGKLSCCREVSRHRGRREHGDRGERVRTVHCTVGVPESQFSGWRPVWLTAILGAARCREKKPPKVDRQGREGGSTRVSERLTLVSCFHLCVGLPPLESCELSCGKAAESAWN